MGWMLSDSVLPLISLLDGEGMEAKEKKFHALVCYIVLGSMAIALVALLLGAYAVWSSFTLMSLCFIRSTRASLSLFPLHFRLTHTYIHTYNCYPPLVSIHLDETGSVLLVCLVFCPDSTCAIILLSIHMYI